MQDVSQRCFNTFKFYPKREELEVVNKIGKREDYILIADAGWGKTLIYSLPLLLWPNDILVVIRPLVVLGDEQAAKFEAVGIPCICLKSGIQFKTKKHNGGCYRAVFMLPKMIFKSLSLAKLWDMPEWKSRLNTIVVDALNFKELKASGKLDDDVLATSTPDIAAGYF
ncbi:hypothetical protein BX616_003967 [Lobosporangium transversale]|nr:hypothetical protein BX616_003967 [Lobosporangium transversale]